MPLTQAIAQYILTNMAGCRYGSNTSGAGYCFTDIVGDGAEAGHPDNRTYLEWVRNPNDSRFEPRWDDRLWNTCAVIVGLSTQGDVLLLSKMAVGAGAERYRVPNPDVWKGDGYSFCKLSRIPSDSKTLGKVSYEVVDGDLLAATQRLFEEINERLKSLAEKVPSK